MLCSQRLQVHLAHQTVLRLSLLEAIHGFRYFPEAQCKECNRRLNAVEIIAGFLENPRDYTTECPKCKHRFTPTLKLQGSTFWSGGYLPFYCAAQTLDQLLGISPELSQHEIERAHPAIFHSVRVHFSTLKKAFAENGVTYTAEEIESLEKLRQCLGKAPDTMIAEVFNRKVGVIWRMRKKAGIPAFRNPPEAKAENQE